MSWLRLAEGIHGHLGVLAVAILGHPAVLLRRGTPLSFAGRAAIVSAMVFTAAAFGLGLALYGDYRQEVRRDLFMKAPHTGLLFETKEHLAYAVTALALGAGLCALLAPRAASELRRAAGALFLVAALLCMLTASLGVLVAATESF